MRATLIRSLLDYPLFTRLIGLLIAIGGSWLVYQQGLELQRMQALPSVVEMSILPEAVHFNHTYYVTLRGGHWDCSSLSVDRPTFDHPRLPQTNVIYQGTGSFVVFARFLGIRTCADLQNRPLTGTIHEVMEPDIFDLREFYPAVDQLPRAYAVYNLCTTCRPLFPLLGLLGGAFLVAFGLMIVPILRALQKESFATTAEIYGLGPRWERRKR